MDFALAAPLGLLIGSFLNVCIYRMPRDMSVVYPGSHCTKCGKAIRWYQNIPILSWIVLRAKCGSSGLIAASMSASASVPSGW